MQLTESSQLMCLGELLPAASALKHLHAFFEHVSFAVLMRHKAYCLR